VYLRSTTIITRLTEHDDVIKSLLRGAPHLLGPALGMGLAKWTCTVIPIWWNFQIFRRFRLWWEGASLASVFLQDEARGWAQK